MNVFVLSCLVAIASALYTDTDEKVDITAIDNDVEEMKRYFACFLDKGDCTDTMMGYKRHFNQSFHNACAECSPLHKHISEEFLKTAMAKVPELVKELKEKYDPEGKDFGLLLKELAKYDY